MSTVVLLSVKLEVAVSRRALAFRKARHWVLRQSLGSAKLPNELSRKHKQFQLWLILSSHHNNALCLAWPRSTALDIQSILVKAPKDNTGGGTILSTPDHTGVYVERDQLDEAMRRAATEARAMTVLPRLRYIRTES